MFSDEEVKQCETPNVGSDVVRAIMTKAAKLLAVRGGTMTGQESSALFEVPWVVNRVPMERVQAHLAAQGARMAVLETEKARLCEGNELLSERLHSAEESVRELTRRAQQAEAQVERLASDLHGQGRARGEPLGRGTSSVERRRTGPTPRHLRAHRLDSPSNPVAREEGNGMSHMCDVPDCTRPAFEESLGHLCVDHAEACEKARGGDSWMAAFIDAGPDADEDEVAQEWYSRWLVGQAP